MKDFEAAQGHVETMVAAGAEDAYSRFDRTNVAVRVVHAHATSAPCISSYGRSCSRFYEKIDEYHKCPTITSSSRDYRGDWGAHRDTRAKKDYDVMSPRFAERLDCENI